MECLKLKNNKLTELLEYCSSKKFKISTSELEHLENFLIKKQKICKEISKLDKSITKFASQKSEDEAEVIQQNNDLIGKILAIDRSHLVLFNKIQELFKGDMKAAKQNIKTTNAYSGAYINSIDNGTYFDRRS